MILNVVLISFILFTSCFSNGEDYEGEEASIGNHSYMAVLTLKGRLFKRTIFSFSKTRCVSVLVSSEYAVTSARCASTKLLRKTSRELTYGCSDLSEPDCNKLELRNDPIIHPDYREHKFRSDNDIAVFRIEKPVKDEKLTPVKLPELSENEPEGNGTLVFWASSENEYLNDVLRKVPVSVTKCNRRLASKTSFCVGNLISPDRVEAGSAFVIGDTLYGIAKANYDGQISFTNVASVVKFVNKEADLK